MAAYGWAPPLGLCRRKGRPGAQTFQGREGVKAAALINEGRAEDSCNLESNPGKFKCLKTHSLPSARPWAECWDWT